MIIELISLSENLPTQTPPQVIPRGCLGALSMLGLPLARAFYKSEPECDTWCK